MKRLGIAIDGVLRDFNMQFEKVYRQKFIYNESQMPMTSDGQLQVLSEYELEGIQNKIESEEKRRIRLPINTGDLLNHFTFDSQDKTYIDSDGSEVKTTTTPRQELEKFIEDHPFQILGKAQEMFKGALDYVNRIQSYGLETGKYETIIVSKNSGRQISSTLFFLAEYGCRVKNYAFVNNDYEKWRFCDDIIDASVETIQSKGNENRIIKIENPANQWDSCDFSFSDIKEVYQFIKNNNLYQ